MKHSLFKRLVQVFLSVLLVGQIQLIYLSLKHNGIPLSKTLLENYIPQTLRFQTERILFYFPYHFRITEATLAPKASHQIQINLPQIKLSWAPLYPDLNFKRWSLKGTLGTVLTDYYPSEIKLSNLNLKFADNQIERAYIQLQDSDKILQIRYRDRGTAPIEAIEQSLKSVQWDALDLDKNPDILELIQSLHSSKNTTIHCSLERTPSNRYSVKVNGSSGSVSYSAHRLEALQIRALFEASEPNIHFRAKQFKNTQLGIQFNSIIGQYGDSIASSTPELIFSANTVHYKNYSLEYATARIQEISTQAHTIEASLFNGHNSLQVYTEYRNASPSIALYFNGHINPKSLDAFIPELKTVPKFDLLTKTLHTSGLLQLNTALEPLEAEGYFQGENLRLLDTVLNYQNTQFQYRGNQIKAQTKLRIAERNLSIDSKINLDDQDYRFLLKGTVYPTESKELLPSWWQAIFQKFSFTSESYVQGDFCLYGNFKKPIPDQFFGSVLAKHIHYRSVHFPYGRVRIQGANYCTAITLDEVHMDVGQAKGQIMTTVKPDGFKEIESLRINLIGALSTENAARLFGGPTALVLEKFQSPHAHEFEFTAALFNPHYQQHSGKSYYNLYTYTKKPFTFFDRPFDSLQAHVHGRNSEHFIRSAWASFAQGTALFQADITETLSSDPQLHLKLQLAECDYDLCSQYLFNQIQSSTTKELERALQLDLELESKGALFDLTRHHGSGLLKIEGEQLSKIYLLGPFSKALNELNIPIGTFKLNQLESRFLIRGDSIQVPELNINGNQSHVFGSGHVYIPDQTIDFNIKIDPLKNANLSFTIFGELGRRFNPVIHILDFKVTGTAKKQKWRSRFDPRNLLGL